MYRLNNIHVNLTNHKINADEGQTTLISYFVINFL